MFISAGSIKQVRIIAAGLALTFCMAITAALCISPPPSFAAEAGFTDLPQGHQAYPFVRYLAGEGLVRGYPDGSFGPEGQVTRAEAASMLAGAAGLGGQAPAAPTFSDVGPGHWAYGKVEADAAAGMIRGYPDGSFRPEEPVTRAEVSALVLKLTSHPLPAVAIPASVQDVGQGHWAEKQMAAALSAGLLDMKAENSFAPDTPATRAEVAKGLAVMLNIIPERVEVPLLGTLVPVKGEVSLRDSGGESRTVSGDTACSTGSTIRTGPGSAAEIRFQDGSGLRLEPDTELTIKQAMGQATILRDGTAGAVVGFLKLELSGGSIFGGLASGYVFRRQESGAGISAPNLGLKSLPLIAAATGPLPAEFLLAEAGGETGDSPWWQKPYEERVRVEIDMPWGVAGIKGTFWMNQVRRGSQSTSVASGSAILTAGGQTVNITAGQWSSVSSAGLPPAPPSRMSEDQQNAWVQVEQWVHDRASEIQNNQPVVVPPRPPGAPALPPANQIMNSFNESVSDVAPPSVSSTDPGNNAAGMPANKSISITFSEEIKEGSSYGSIVLKAASGTAIPVTRAVDGSRLVLTPVERLKSGSPVNGVISLTFDMEMVSGPNMSIQLTGGGDIRRISAGLSGKQLTAEYKGLAYGTAYTVVMPAGILKSRDYGTFNEEISWTFTTETAPPR